MSSIVSYLKNKFGECTCNSCKKQECKLNLDAFPSEKVILDIDRVTEQELAQIKSKRCDYIIVVKEGASIFLLPVEFKSKWVKPSEVKKQLNGGIDFFKKHHNKQFMCYPVLVSQSLGHGKSSREFQKIKIRYNGKKARITHVKCDKSLSWSEVKGRA